MNITRRSLLAGLTVVALNAALGLAPAHAQTTAELAARLRDADGDAEFGKALTNTPMGAKEPKSIMVPAQSNTTALREGMKNVLQSEAWARVSRLSCN